MHRDGARSQARRGPSAPGFGPELGTRPQTCPAEQSRPFPTAGEGTGVPGRFSSQLGARAVTRRGASLVPAPATSPRRGSQGPVQPGGDPWPALRPTDSLVQSARRIAAGSGAGDGDDVSMREHTYKNRALRPQVEDNAHPEMRRHAHEPRENIAHLDNSGMRYFIFQLTPLIATQTKAINLICTQITLLPSSLSQEGRGAAAIARPSHPQRHVRKRGDAPDRRGGGGSRSLC